MRILYVSAEVEPFAKSGGLGDVLGALPKAIAKKDNEVSVVMPYYKRLIDEKFQSEMEYVGYYYVDVAWRHQYCGLFKLVKDNVTIYFLDNEYYFGGDIYCFADNERFAYFAKASLDLIGYLGKPYDVIHCNDWSSGLVPVLFDAFYRSNQLYSNTKLVYTIHNLRYQGWMSKFEAQDLTGLDDFYFTQDRLMNGDCVNVMKGAIVFSDVVTTVSETYAREIATPEYGEYLDGLINQYSYKTHGILNGVDYKTYSPWRDKLIFNRYSKKSVKEGKSANKLQLQQELGLPQDQEVMMIGLISRLVDQKGLHLVDRVMERLANCRVQFVVLGTGEKRYEDMFRYYQGRYPDKISANIRFNNQLAHKIYAACDLFLMPSDFEPCGLSQIIALKYGTLPLVRETGGLKDTVSSYNEYTGKGNGFSFANSNADDMWYTLCRAMQFYYDKPDVWAQIVQNGLKCNFSWAKSSKTYIKLYQSLISK